MNQENQTPETTQTQQPIQQTQELDWTMSDEQVNQMVEEAHKLEEQIKNPNATQAQETTETEQLLAGKYKTPEELEKGVINLLQKMTGTDNLEDLYKALESQLGTQQESTEQESDVSEQAQDAIESYEEIISQYVQDYLNTGEVPKELLEKTGLPADVAKLALEAKAGEYREYAEQLVSTVGGFEQFEQLMMWAENNLPYEVQASIAAAIQTGDIHLASLVLEALQNRAAQANPQLYEGEAAVSGGGDIYHSIEDVLNDINDPRYGTDPRYTKEVEAKIIRSGIDISEL